MVLPTQAPQFDPAQLRTMMWQPEPPPQFDAARIQALMEQIRLQRVAQQNQFVEALVGFGKAVLVGGVIIFGLAGAVSLLVGEDPKPRYCSLCDREGHDARNCTRRGERLPIPSWLEKSGRCECCEQRFRNTYWHHYAGRGVDKWMEMCLECHVNCGHNGHTQNDAVRPYYCRKWAA